MKYGNIKINVNYSKKCINDFHCMVEKIGKIPCFLVISLSLYTNLKKAYIALVMIVRLF